MAEVRQSKKLIGFFELVLAVGNYINGSTPRGGAFGFKFESIRKVHQDRSAATPTRKLLLTTRSLYRRATDGRSQGGRQRDTDALLGSLD